MPPSNEEPVKDAAARHGIDLSHVQGSGPGGRITRRDVEAAGVEQQEAAWAACRTGTIVSTGVQHYVPAGALKHIADRVGVDLSHVQGSGPGGRITLQDVNAAAAGQLEALRQFADRVGVDLSHVQGSGPGGHITHRDVDAAAAGQLEDSRAVLRAAAGPEMTDPNIIAELDETEG